MRTPASWMLDRAAQFRSFWKLEWIGEDDLYLQAFSEITPNLFVGRIPTAENVAQLRSRGITHVISCLQELRRGDVEFLGADFEHVFLPADDEMQHDMGRTIGHFFAHVDAARAIDPAAKMLVHCEVGVSRSVSLAIALLMRDDHLSLLDSYELVRSSRIQALPNIAFASQLQHLEHELQPEAPAARSSSLALYLTRYCSAPCDVDELEHALERHEYDAPAALRSIYGGEIPRVVQGVRSASR